MNIVLCLKPIRTELVYPNERRNEKFVISPYDLKALADWVELKKTMKCQLHVMIMGSEATKETTVKALAMGADEAYLISDRIFGGSDTVATTYILSKALKKLAVADVVVCGQQSVDGETGQVGYGLAERLGWHCISQVHQVRSINDNSLRMIRESGGYHEEIEVQAPVFITYKGFITDSGKISLMALKRAKQKVISVWNAEDLAIDSSLCGLSGSKTKVLEIKNDLVKKDSIRIEGDAVGKARELLNLVKYQQVRSTR